MSYDDEKKNSGEEVLKFSGLFLCISLAIAVHLSVLLHYVFSLQFKVIGLYLTYYSIGIGVKQNRKVCVRFEAPQLNSLISCIIDQRCQYVCENNKDGKNLVTKKSSTSIETQIYGKVFFIQFEISQIEFEELGSGAVVRVLAAHHRVQGSIPGPGVELIMVGSRPCSKGFLHVPQISSLLNTNIQIQNSTWKQWTNWTT